jgi:hypothetical protein
MGADGALHRVRVVGVTGFAGAHIPAAELDTFDTPTVAVLQTGAAQRLLGRGETWTRSGCAPLPEWARRRCAIGSPGCCRPGGWRR